MLQIILYNQINKSFLIKNVKKILYIHYYWKINFLWHPLKINTFSRVIDYSCGKNLIESLKKENFDAEFVLSKNYFETIKKYCQKNNVSEVFIVKPLDNYFYQNLLKISKKLNKIWINIRFVQDKNSVLISQEEFISNFPSPPIMEYFYRFMRKKFNILIENDGSPVWWKWNFDKENRWFDKKHIKNHNFNIEKNLFYKEAEQFYNFSSKINYPTTREEALLLLDYFCKNHLDDFGKLEDAMYTEDAFVNHSLLSTAINFGLLSPLEVIKKVNSSNSKIESKEWFIRQIIWWREYMYHFFEFYKDDIYKNNFFWYDKKLDNFFRWENLNSLKMNCLKCVLKRVNDINYSHHIERLMIIWNFSLLYWYNPHELNRWFFEMYTDAFEWVVSPNVLSMSQYSDWWKMATKPYVSSWNYINKMSDYCKYCFYDVKDKYSENACPFNYLYWNFIYENKEHLKTKRQSFLIKQLDKIDIKKIKQLKNNFKFFD